METGTGKITSSIKQDSTYITLEMEGTSEKATKLLTDVESMASTKSIRGNLFNIIEIDALNHPQTV
jgi:hypothetical protein